MQHQWIKLWSEKILSSLNLRQCNFTENSVYLQLLIRARTDDKFIGHLCYPDGKPMLDEELAKDMKLKVSLFKKAIDGLLERSVLIGTSHGYLIRKYKDLQKKKGDLENKDELDATKKAQVKKTDESLLEQPRNKSETSSEQPEALPNSTLNIRREEKRTDKDIEKEEIKKKEDMPTADSPPDPKKSVKPKPKDDAPDMVMLREFGSEYKLYVGYTYPASFAKERKMFKDLLNIYPPDLIKRLIEMFFEEYVNEDNKDRWKKKLNVGYFKTQVSELLVKLSEKEEGAEDER